MEASASKALRPTFSSNRDSAHVAEKEEAFRRSSWVLSGAVCSLPKVEEANVTGLEG